MTWRVFNESVRFKNGMSICFCCATLCIAQHMLWRGIRLSGCLSRLCIAWKRLNAFSNFLPLYPHHS